MTSVDNEDVPDFVYQTTRKLTFNYFNPLKHF